MFGSLTGLRLMPDAHMTEDVNIGLWLNGYRPSKNRSKRVFKKLLARMNPIIETRPASKVYFMGNNIIGHPETLELLKAEASA